MGVLLLKLFLAPALIVVSALAGRRWGPAVAGVLVGLPIVAGPILFITYRQHGADFAARAAGSSLLGLVSLAVFAVVFAHVGRQAGWVVTTATTWIAVLGVDFALSFAHVPALGAFACSLAATTLAMLSMPKPEPERELKRSPTWDLPARAVATGVLVLVITTASSALGPGWTGLLAPFPIATTVLAGFVHAQQGSAVATRALVGVLTGLPGFAAFCFVLAVVPLGIAAFALGIAAAAVVQLLVTRLGFRPPAWPAGSGSARRATPRRP
ncbi:hypothetical protein [Lentzea sp.]|uniref:hypothetical protein n=1 Tax=Lentzea sp. TaxID=56099 RepID=UPI002C4F5934|nr:hypothetical protein [Lentzea sp.]HUQ61577.1 hypothetical protein [Lentzea sp.]